MKKKSKTKRRIIMLMPICVLIIAYSGYYLTSTILTIEQRKHEKEALIQYKEELEEESYVLKEEIKKLETNEYIARYVREKLLYSKDNEIIFRLED